MQGSHLRLVGVFAIAAILAGCGKAASPTASTATTFLVSGVVREQWGVQSPPIPFATVRLMTGTQTGREVCPPGPLTVERTEVFDPGTYSLRVVMLRLGPEPTDKREMYLSYPR